MNSLFWAFLFLNIMFPSTAKEMPARVNAPAKVVTVNRVEASVSSVSLDGDAVRKRLEGIAEKTYKALKESLTVWETYEEKALNAIKETKETKAKDKTKAKSKKSGNAVTVTDEEREILYRIVEAEATDGTKQQKKNVASCILARVESKDFPNTVKDVVFEKNQFTPLYDGRYYSVKITDSTKEAVDEILENGREHDYLFFCSYGCKSSYFAKKDQNETPMKDGMHRYYLK